MWCIASDHETEFGIAKFSQPLAFIFQTKTDATLWESGSSDICNRSMAKRCRIPVKDFRSCLIENQIGRTAEFLHD